MQSEFQLCGSALGHFLPEHAKTLWSNAQKHNANAPMSSAGAELFFERMHSSGSFNILTADGTVKIGMGVKRFVAKRAVTLILLMRFGYPAVFERLRFDRSHIVWQSHVLPGLERVVGPQERSCVQWLDMDIDCGALY